MKPHLAVLTFFGLLCPLAANGQEGTDSVSYVFPPVTTIGTRFAEPWVQVPLAISTITQRDMVRGKGYGLDEVLSGVPGVLAQSRYGNHDIRLSIRGFGARGAGAKSNAGTTRGLRILVDGFPETEPDGRTSLDLVDLPSAGGVEIVRSNVSSVYGNASGGVVNVLSNTNFSQPFTEVQSITGSYGYHAEAVRAGAMLGAGRFFFSLTNRNADGWRAHSRSSQSLLNTGVITPLGETGSLGIYVTGTNNSFRIPGPLSQAQFDSLAQQADSTYIKRDERRHNRVGRVGLSLTHGIGEANAITATAFVGAKDIQRSERNTFRDFDRYHAGGSVTFRTTIMFSASIRNSVVAGADEAYQGGAVVFRNLVMNPVTLTADRGTAIIQNKTEGAGHFGAFIQDEVRFGDRVSLLVGARYDNITYSYENLLDPKLSDSRSFERVTPKVGISYMLSPAHSVYANIGGGVEVPAGNEIDPAPTFGTDTLRMLNPLLAPIHSTTVEAGTKHLLSLDGAGLRGWLTYDLAIYWLQVYNDIIPYDDGSYYLTAGRTRRMGIESAAQIQLAMGLTVDGALTVSENTYDEYTVDSVHFGKAGRSADLGGNAVAGVPDLFYSAGVKYAPQGFQGAYVRIGVQGVGRYFADDRNMYDVPSYVVLNASAGIDRLLIGRSGLFIRGFIGMNNVMNRRYAAAAWINPQLNARHLPVYLEPGLPRNIVGSISAGWEF